MNAAVVTYFEDLASRDFSFAVNKAEQIPDIISREWLLRKMIVKGVQDQSAGSIFCVLDYLQKHEELVSPRLLAKIEPHAQRAGFSITAFDFTLEELPVDMEKKRFIDRVREDFATAMQETELVQDQHARVDLMRTMIVASVKKKKDLPSFTQALSYLRNQPYIATGELLAKIEHCGLKSGICQVSEHVVQLAIDLGIHRDALEDARKAVYQSDPYLADIAEAIGKLFDRILFGKCAESIKADCDKVASQFSVLSPSDDKAPFAAEKTSLLDKWKALIGKKATVPNRKCLLSIYSQFLSLGMHREANKVLLSLFKTYAHDMKRAAAKTLA